MKSIILELEINDSAKPIDVELMELGKKCDVDLDHVPFKEFTIYMTVEPKAFKNLVDEIANERADSIIALNPQGYNMLDRIELVNEIKEKLKNKNVKREYMELDITFTDDCIYIDNKKRYKAKLKSNKKQFNFQYDEDLDITFEDIVSKITNKNELSEEMHRNIYLLFGILCFLQTSKIEVKPTLNKTKPKSKGSNKSNNKKQKRYIYNKVYKINDKLLENLTESVSKEEGIKDYKRTYKISSWYQRGHWRTYKTGKKVWIKPQFKYPRNIKNKENKEETTTYKITHL